MYLNQLKAKNFRSFDEISIPLYPDLTVFLGENNGGKSNAIDALRLLTSPLSGRRDLYCESTDVRFGGSSAGFELESHFDALSPAQAGRLLCAVADKSLTRCLFGLSYDESNGRHPARPRLWAGPQRETPELGSHDMIRHVYLPPLRDAKRALASGNPTRIHALLRYFLDGQSTEDVARDLARGSSAPVLTRVGEAVEQRLDQLTAGVRRQGTSLGFAGTEKLLDIARDLRFKLSDHGIEPEDLRYSGHGYANLLFMATIAIELERADDVDLTLFLVEEPEAHLHPQLQAAVLGFLEEQAEKAKTRVRDKHAPAGSVQAVVATHSPNLSAWVASEKLVLFQSSSSCLAPTPATQAKTMKAAAEAAIKAANGPATEAVAVNERSAPPLPHTAVADAVIEAAQSPSQFALHPEATARPSADTAPVSAPPRRASRCIPLAALPLSPIDRRKVDRYLDVTKSAVLFGGRAVLVEGIAEALLLPVIAKKYVLRDQTDKLRVLRSTVFVPIDGVDFEPYVRLLLTVHNHCTISHRVVVVTDGDGWNLGANQSSPGSLRKSKLLAFAEEQGVASALDVAVNDFSLESELVLAGNEALLKTAYLGLHPQSEPRWTSALAHDSKEGKASAIQDLFKSTPKGDFAQVLAEAIAESETFTVPRYLKIAIEAAVR